MCGIAGIVNLGEAPPPSIDALTRMAGALHHRGPDEFGVYRDAHCGLAHARLSIIDVATGQQPLASDDGALWIAFNGEIFNYVELRAELSARGHRFRTQSDTEVIVQAYRAWGDAAFARFNGQWAVALWDARERRLVLSRDRVGVRPLYVCAHANRLVFASEVKAIFAADASIPRALDPKGLDQTFTFWSVVPPQTVFAGVEELRPGVVRTYQGATYSEREYDPLSFPEGGEGAFRGSLDDAVVAVREALEEATRLRMVRSDVPVGSYLSGGLDSSLVAALGVAARTEPFHTFSLRFEDAEYDETSYQRAMAAHLGSEHHEVVCRKADIAAELPHVVLHTERPILRTAPVPLLLLSRLVRASGIKVVLTGEGADEMFAGYDLFRESKVRRFWARHPKSPWRPLLLERLYPYLARSPVAQRAMMKQFFGHGLERANDPGFSHDPRWRTTSALKRLFSNDMTRATEGFDAAADFLRALPTAFSRWSPLAQDQAIEIKTLLSGYLLSSQGDRVLMASSVEGRFPFLDVNVMRLACSLPASYKLHVLDEKHVLKRASVGRVPDVIRARPKQPYRAPDALAFVHEDAPAYVAEAMGARAVGDAGVFDAGRVAHLWAKVRAASARGQLSNSDNMAIVGILSTQLLHDRLIASPPSPRPITLNTLVDRLAP